MAAAIHSPCERLLPIGRGTSVVDRKSLRFRWCRLRPRCKERGGGDVVTSLTTSDAADRPQPAPALRVAGAARIAGACPEERSDEGSRRLASAGSAPATKAKGFSVHYTEFYQLNNKATTAATSADFISTSERRWSLPKPAASPRALSIAGWRYPISYTTSKARKAIANQRTAIQAVAAFRSQPRYLTAAPMRMRDTATTLRRAKRHRVGPKLAPAS